jgi:CRP-like cAMP-binding protein
MFPGWSRQVADLLRHGNDTRRSTELRLGVSQLSASRPARSAIYSLTAAAILHFSHVTSEDACMIIIAAVALILIPVAGFTLNQVVLTRTGRRFARTVPEIVLLKESDAKAFTRPLVALISKSRQRAHSRRQWPGAPQIASYDPSGSIAAADVLATPGLLSESGRRGRAVGYPPAAGFWGQLSPAEQRALVTRARLETIPAGEVLWRQGDRGDHVLVIASGQTMVYREDALGQQVIATRGQGDVIGERAALRVESRSATVITVDAVRALVVMTADFAALITEHPRVLKILESEIYGRLIESRPDRPSADEVGVWPLAPPRPGSASSRWTGQNCSICFTDITAFSHPSRREQDRQAVRAAMYRMLADAFNDSGVPWHACHREDRGDGVLIVIPPGIPTGRVVEAVVNRLTTALRRHNRRAQAATRIQMRVAIHVGPVTTDAEGVSGHAINQAARFIQAAAVKRSIADASADLVLVTSEFVYDTVISPEHGPAELASYQRLQFRAKGAERVAWMCLAGSANRESL